MEPSPSRSVDAVVVGAGLAGLVCARRLTQGGASVALVEANDRVGGRTLGRRIGGAFFDIGGQWLGPGQLRVRALTDELGLFTTPTPHDGEHVLVASGRTIRYRGTIPRLRARSLLEIGGAIARTYGMALRVPLDGQPTRAAARYDASAADAIVAGLGLEARASFDAAFRTVFGAEARDVSLLWYLLYTRAGGGFFRLVDVEGGAQERRIVGGASTLSSLLAKDLGGAVVLGAPVRRVEQHGEQVTVKSDALEIRARRAVVAVPPSLLGRIEFDPAPPHAWRELTASMRMGATVKVLALYERPFWREQGLSGQAATDGLLSVVFDNTSTDGAQPALVGFIVGDAARRWRDRSAADQRNAVTEQLAGIFGPSAREPTDLVMHDWSTEPWAGGCPVASPPPGLLAGRAACLRAPHGRIHWAGTETASRHIGYLDGAVSSGERAATEVLAALGR